MYMKINNDKCHTRSKENNSLLGYGAGSGPGGTGMVNSECILNEVLFSTC